MCRSLDILEASKFWSPIVLSRFVMGLLYSLRAYNIPKIDNNCIKIQGRTYLLHDRSRRRGRIILKRILNVWDDMHRIDLLQERDYWLAVVRTVMKCPIPYKTPNWSTCCDTLSFSRSSAFYNASFLASCCLSWCTFFYLHCFQLWIAASNTEIIHIGADPITLNFSNNFIFHIVVN